MNTDSLGIRIQYPYFIKNGYMLQIFYKKSEISRQDWAFAYQKIGEIVEAFPLPLMRIEAYDGWSPHLDKEHLDLRVEVGKPLEHISIYGDQMSFTAGTTVRFYKNWKKQIELELSGTEYDVRKPITWAPYHRFQDDGSFPDANGLKPKYERIDPRGALYKYAILAIGVFLENKLPGKVFLTAVDQNREAIIPVIEWLEGHFQEPFEMPVYFDKKRLLASFIDEYEDKMHAVAHMEQLFRKQFKRNMQFAIEFIGYEPAFECYAEVLTNYTFNTFGFSDVLDAWIAVTKDLEAALALVASCKQMRIQLAEDDLTEQAEIEKEFDLSSLLTELLNDYILWTPQQREALGHFYTNEQSLETGRDDLFGAIMRIGGKRVDICPIYCTERELFEAFMYHDPKNGNKYKDIIENWITKNHNAYDQLINLLREKEAAQDETEEDESEVELYEKVIETVEHENFIQKYPSHDQFFIRRALEINPACSAPEKAVALLREEMKRMNEKDENLEYVQDLQQLPIERKKELIRKRIKEKRHTFTVGTGFDQWLADEMEENTLSFLLFLVNLKIYGKGSAYARVQILQHRIFWKGFDR